MPNFRYQALNPAQQVVSGEITAESVLLAISELEGRGLTVQSIGQASSPAATSADRNDKRTTAPAASDRSSPEGDDGQTILRAQLAKVIEKSELLMPALRAFAGELPPGRRHRQLRSVLRSLRDGDVDRATSSFAAMSDIWIPLLGATATPRSPGQVLREFVHRWQVADKLRRQWQFALTYPLIATGLAVAVAVFLCIVVVPTFRDIFEEFDLQLPVITLQLVQLSDWIVSGRILIVLGALVVVFLLVRGAMLLLPEQAILGVQRLLPQRIGYAASIGRLVQATADLLAAGFSIPNAVRVAGIASDRPLLRRAATRVAGEIESGVDLSRRSARLLTSIFVHALSAEMSLKTRIKLLREISACFVERAERRFSWKHGLVGPLAIIATGLVVAWTVLALFLPLVRLLNGLA